MRIARPTGVLAAILAFGVLAATAPQASAHDTTFNPGGGLVIVFGGNGDRQAAHGGNHARARQRAQEYRHRERVRARQARRARARAWRRHRARTYQQTWYDQAYWR